MTSVKDAKNYLKRGILKIFQWSCLKVVLKGMDLHFGSLLQVSANQYTVCSLWSKHIQQFLS